MCVFMPDETNLQWVMVSEIYNYVDDKENKMIKLYHQGIDCYETIGYKTFVKYFTRL